MGPRRLAEPIQTGAIEQGAREALSSIQPCKGVQDHVDVKTFEELAAGRGCYAVE